MNKSIKTTFGISAFTALVTATVVAPVSYFASRQGLRDLYRSNPQDYSDICVEVTDLIWSEDYLAIYVKIANEENYTAVWPAFEVEFYRKDGTFVGEYIEHFEDYVEASSLENAVLKVMRNWSFKDWGEDLELKVSLIDYRF